MNNKNLFLVLVMVGCVVPQIALAKKGHTSSSSSVQLGPPQVIEKGDILIGPRIGLGAVTGGGLAAFGAAGEYMLTENIGLGGQFAYSGNSQVFPGGSYNYSNILIIAQGSYHADLFKVKNLDTFLSVGLGYDIVSLSVTGIAFGSAATGSGLAFMVTANARYFFNDKWSVVGTLGYGLGVLALGVDYRL